MPRPSDLQIVHYKQLIGRYRDHAASGLASVWDGLDNHDDVTAFRAQTAPVLAAAKHAAVITAAAFTARALGVPPTGVRADDIAVTARISDPFLALQHAIAVGRPWADAVAAGRSMAEAVGVNFVQSAARRTGDSIARASGHNGGWERVPSGDACEWCVEVSGQLYQSAESADFGHDRCSCAAVPA